MRRIVVIAGVALLAAGIAGTICARQVPEAGVGLPSEKASVLPPSILIPPNPFPDPKPTQPLIIAPLPQPLLTSPGPERVLAPAPPPVQALTLPPIAAPSQPPAAAQSNAKNQSAPALPSLTPSSESLRNTPQMIGDLLSGGFIIVNGQPTVRAARVPLAARGAFKISENESPRPQDRVFISDNFFHNVATFGASAPIDVWRTTLGIEKTLLDGAASIGARLPHVQGRGDGAVGIDGLGDISLLFKYAFYDDPAMGDLLSGGMVVTVPSGVSQRTVDNTKIHPTLFQPWAGFIANTDRGYVQGFTSLVCTTEQRDVSLYTADVGIGLRAYEGPKDSIVASLIPTIEAHLTVPLDNVSKAASSPIYFPNIFSVTGGVHVGFSNRSNLSLGLNLPVSGPSPYDCELIAQFNYRY